jgi:hypothetical protein
LKARKKVLLDTQSFAQRRLGRQVDQPFHLAHHALVGAEYLARQLARRPHQLIRRDHAVDQPEPLRVPCVQIVAGQ